MQILIQMVTLENGSYSSTHPKRALRSVISECFRRRSRCRRPTTIPGAIPISLANAMMLLLLSGVLRRNCDQASGGKRKSAAHWFASSSSGPFLSMPSMMIF